MQNRDVRGQKMLKNANAICESSFMYRLRKYKCGTITKIHIKILGKGRNNFSKAKLMPQFIFKCAAL